MDRAGAGRPGRKLVFEGEKVASLAKGLGLVATTSAHGARSAHKTDWSPMAGQEIVIVPDAGDAGERHAAEVLAILSKLRPMATVRISRLPGLSDGEDLEQWIEDIPDGWNGKSIGSEKGGID